MLSKITIFFFQKDTTMSSLANGGAYDSDSKNSEDESKVEREVAKGQDPEPPLKRGLDEVFDKKKEEGDGR